MKSHISIIATEKNKPLVLPAGFTLDMEFKNPLFNDYESFSYPVKIPFEGNRALLENMDDINSDLRPVSKEHTPLEIRIDGMPFVRGFAVTQEDEDISEGLSVNIESSTRTLTEILGDLNCQDVPLLDDILIGEKIGNIKIDAKFNYEYVVTFASKKSPSKYPFKGSSGEAQGEFEPQALGFSYPAKCKIDRYQTAKIDYERIYDKNNKVMVPQIEESYINVSDPYPIKPYCNARVCYPHHKLDEESGKTSDDIVPAVNSTNQYEDKSPFWVLDANRPQSGICFYVLYFLDCLFAHLGYSFNKDELMAVEDFKHLCFFTTHCKYRTKVLHDTEDSPYFKRTVDKHGSALSQTDLDYLVGKDPADLIDGSVNVWLYSRGCGGRLKITMPEPKQVEEATVTSPIGTKTHYKVGSGDITSIETRATYTSCSFSANIMAMYATSENFPDAEVTKVLSSLENQFGIKFDIDEEKKSVTARLIRNVFNSQSAPLKFNGKVLSMTKVSEKITGVRVYYSNESDSKEQQENVRKGKRDYDTDYDYVDYPKDRTITDKTYKDLFRGPFKPEDISVYIDKTTGNAYRIKVDKNATSGAELRPRLYEVGTFAGIRVGDCSQANEDFIEEFASDFVPINFSDVNYYKELSMADGSTKVTVDEEDWTIDTQGAQPILAATIEDDMEREFVEFQIKNTVTSPYADCSIIEVLKLVESYDPSKTEDGNSPLQSHDWGLAIAMMRGGGTDATRQWFDGNYDGFGNSKWRSVVGEYALTSDSMDAFGNEFDYNGVSAGIGEGERFSLKICAYKQPDWADAPIINDDQIDPGTGKMIKKIRTRGTYDAFLQQLVYFILNRKKFRTHVLATAAQILDIRNHWREWYEINGKRCLINKINTQITLEEGLSDIEMEVYSI